MCLMTVHCAHCGKEMSWPIKDMPTDSFKLVVETHNVPCDKCHQTREAKHDYSLCSLKCLKAFVKALREGDKFPPNWGKVFGKEF